MTKEDFWVKAGISAAVLLFLLNCLSGNLADLDVWGYLAFGRLFWNSDTFPYRDVFSYIPTRNLWVYHEWLTGVLFYPLYMAWGSAGLQALKYLLGLATLALVYQTARVRGAKPLAAAIILASIAPGIIVYYFPVRAQVFTFFFFALTLYLLEVARKRNTLTALLPLPAMQLIWCNLHGGFLAGLGLIALYGAGEFFSRRPSFPFFLIFGLSVLATLINPYGVHYWEYMLHAILKPRPYITEWFSVVHSIQRGNIADAFFLGYLVVLTFPCLYGIWYSRRYDVTTILVMSVIFIMGIKHIRHLIFVYLVVGAYLPDTMTGAIEYLQSRRWLKEFGEKTNVKRTVFITSMIITILLGHHFIKVEPFSMKIPPEPGVGSPFFRHFPVGAVDYIRLHGLTGNLLSEFGWGEYLIWNLYPHCLVAFDGRYETVYPEEVEKKYWEFSYGAPQWRQFLESYPPDLILLRPKAKITDLIEKDLDWQKIYEDGGCVLFQKRPETAGQS